jgi:hypothetical protein
MSFRRSLAVATFTVFAVAGTTVRPKAAEAAPVANQTSCGAFKVSTISSQNVFKAQGTLERTISQNAAIPFPEIKICCYKYLGCFLCFGSSTTTK